LHRRCLMFLLTAILIFSAGCNSNTSCPITSPQNTPINQVGDEQPETFGSTKDITSIEVVLDPDGYYTNEVKPIFVTDAKMIHDIMSMIEESKQVEDEFITSKISVMAYKNNKLVITKTNGDKKEITFAYDPLYEVGYLEDEGKNLEPDYSFFRYMADLNEYANPDTNIENDVLKLFGKYDWTVDYRINTLKEKLPGNLKHKAGQYPVEIYWAYNNELSKGIGLDFAEYLGKDVTVEIYRLREPLPEFMRPRADARGIVVKFKNEIVGAYIDAGRYGFMACSLDRKSLKEVSGKEWNVWIEDYIDFEDELEIRLSKMDPEDIVREYFKAIDERNEKMIRACTKRENQLKSIDMDSQDHFNKNDSKIDSNIKKAKLLEIKEFKGLYNEPDVLEYEVSVDFEFEEPMAEGNGVLTRFVILKKESEKSGWRISSVGTGP